MKKLFSVSLILCSMLLTFNSCKDEQPCQCSHNSSQVINDSSQIINNPNQIINVSVYRNDWKYSDLGIKDNNPYANNYFFYTVDVPEITKEVFQGGNVQIYTVMNDEMQHVLPYVRHYEEYNQTDSVWNYFTETVDAFYGVGWVEFQLTSSDFYYEDHIEYAPNAMNFRVVISH